MSSIRTLSSLKWLIGKRARLLGEIAKLERSHPKQIEDARKQVAEAEELLGRVKQKLAFVESGVPRLIDSLRRGI